MKTNKLILCSIIALLMAFGNMGTAQAGKNADMRVAYVLKNLGINRETQAKLKPMLVGYLADKKTANKAYDDMKDRLKPSIDKGMLTEKQAQELLTKKWDAAEKELVVKKNYEKKFRTVLSAKKTYLCFDLLNDKKSKVRGEKGNDDEDDD